MSSPWSASSPRASVRHWCQAHDTTHDWTCLVVLLPAFDRFAPLGYPRKDSLAVVANQGLGKRRHDSFEHVRRQRRRTRIHGRRLLSLGTLDCRESFRHSNAKGERRVYNFAFRYCKRVRQALMTSIASGSSKSSEFGCATLAMFRTGFIASRMEASARKTCVTFCSRGPEPRIFGCCARIRLNKLVTVEFGEWAIPDRSQTAMRYPWIAV